MHWFYTGLLIASAAALGGAAAYLTRRLQATRPTETGDAS